MIISASGRPTAPPLPPGAAAVDIAGVTFTYPGGSSPALESITLRVEPGERLGILGPNGAGKSTLLKLVLGLVPLQQGSISIFGQAPSEARKRGDIAYVSQRVEAELRFPLTVEEAVTLGAGWRTRPWQRYRAALRTQVRDSLALVGVSDLAHRSIGELSGGQLQRVMIARAIAARPRLLVLDEPTVGIDAAGQRQFARLLEAVHRELHLTIVIVSHNLRSIAAGCDRVACLARRLHRHVTPQGLTPEVLGQLFTHDVEGLWSELHVHAHGPGEHCEAHDHPPH